MSAPSGLIRATLLLSGSHHVAVDLEPAQLGRLRDQLAQGAAGGFAITDQATGREVFVAWRHVVGISYPLPTA